MVLTDLRVTEYLIILSDPNSHLQALGLHWDVSQDALHVAIPVLDKNQSATKCTVASSVARIHDLMGWFAPSTVFVTILLQQLWSH